MIARILCAAALVAAGTEVQDAAVPHPIEVVTSVERVSADASRWLLKVRIDVPEGLHVYAEDGAGYEAASAKVTTAAGTTAAPARWPAPSDLLFAMSQPVKVYEGTVEARIDLRLPAAPARALRQGRDHLVAGTLRYQACTDEACYRPREMPLTWTLTAGAAAAPRRAN